MPKNPSPEGIVSRTELTKLAHLFAAFEFAFDPTAQDVLDAEDEFNERVEELHGKAEAETGTRIDLACFDGHFRTLCRRILSKKRR
jgi:hypothetical protein